ncbi:oxidoreductase [Mesorhizobium sp. CAU 1741]|uniref:oxidoreductase n=1 Tax=Mesorhizobium sp. CAU 1741 TaxID=3140366 RepID=UPI00325ABC1C
MPEEQTPISSPFNAHSTGYDVVDNLDLTGKTAIVTGGYSGLGLETVRALTGASATVIVPARDTERASLALEGMEGIEVVAMDLTDSASIAAFASGFLARNIPLPILINSAGVMATPLFRDGDGHEGQFATNHLGHFRLVTALWPALVKARGARVVSVSSRGHQIAGVDFDDIDYRRRPYDRWVAYGQSKTANVLFAVELDRRGKEDGIRAFSLHPGQILTNLARHLSDEDIAGFDALDADGKPIVDPDRGMKTPEQGAATSVWAATSPLLAGKGGLYLEDCNIAPVHAGDPGRKGVAPYAMDPAAAARLWEMSDGM